MTTEQVFVAGAAVLTVGLLMWWGLKTKTKRSELF